MVCPVYAYIAMSDLTDVAPQGGLALFLCSRASAHISGVAIETDGGSRIAGRGFSGKEARETHAKL